MRESSLPRRKLTTQHPGAWSAASTVPGPRGAMVPATFPGVQAGNGSGFGRSVNDVIRIYNTYISTF